MKSYVIVTAAVFGLLTVSHVWRAVVEPRLATDAFFVGVTVLAAALGLWALRLLALEAKR